MASRKALLAPLGALAAVAALVLLVSNVNDGGAGAPFLGFRVLSAGHARQLTDEAEGVMADVERPQPRKSLTQIGAADVVDGRHHTKHLHQTDPVSGAQTHLVYDAIIAESAVSLDADPSLQDVVVAEDCATHERLALVARDAAAARAAAQRLAPGVLLSAGEHWGCADHATKVARKRTSASAPSPTTMTRKVIAQPVVSGNRVMLRTEHVSVAEFFERAEVTLRMSPPGDTTNNVPGQAARVVAEASRDGHTASKRRSPLQQPAPRVSKTKAVSDNFFERVWAGAGALAIDGLAMMRKIAQPPAAIPTGNVRGNNRAYAHPIDWNFDNSTQRARYPRMLRPGLTCSDCWSYMSLSAEFGLVIDNYVFKSATSSVQGNTAFNIGISAAIPKPVKAANQTTIDSIRFPPVSFYVGNVPMTIGINMDMDAGFDIDFKSPASAQFSASFGGWFEYTTYYSHSHGWSVTSSLPGGNSSQPARGSLTAISADPKMDFSVAAFLMPKIVFETSYVSSHFLQLKPMVEFQAGSVQSGATCPVDRATSVPLQAVLNAGMQADAGAFLAVSSLGRVMARDSWGPVTLRSDKFPLLGGCLQVGSPRWNVPPSISALAKPPMIGQVYFGFAERIRQWDSACSNYSTDYDVSLQVVGVDSDSTGKLDVVVSFTPLYGASNGCMWQDLYTATLSTAQQAWSIGPKYDDPSSTPADVVYAASCVDGGKPPYSGGTDNWDVHHFSPDWQSARGVTRDGCLRTTVTRAA